MEIKFIALANIYIYKTYCILILKKNIQKMNT